jgi:hypothetical protein
MVLGHLLAIVVREEHVRDMEHVNEGSLLHEEVSLAVGLGKWAG